MRFFIPDTHFPAGPNMLQRIALVIWWTAASATILCVAAVAASVWFLGASEGAYIAILAAAWGLGSWFAGRSLFFILAAR